MYSRFITTSKNTSFFLFGPRGTGKTSWIVQNYPNALKVDLLESETYNALLSYPQRLEEWLKDKKSKQIIIDEVQKLPSLLDEVHRLIEKYKVQFILTGSSARKLKSANANLLGGRAETYFMHPLTIWELEKDFNLKKSLRFGQLPLAYTREDPKKFLSSYVTTYLKEEIEHEGLTRNIGAFARFLEAASFSQGGVLNISEVARECAVQRKTVEEYFIILEDLLLAKRIPVFTRRARRDVVAHPKFFFFDVGVYRAIRPLGPLDSETEIEGATLETLFLQNCLALNDYLNLGFNFYYWRTREKHEVDFILYGERGLFAFEIKRNSQVKSDDLLGLKEFMKDYPEAKGYLLYGGKKSWKENNIQIIPYEEGLVGLKDLLAG